MPQRADFYIERKDSELIWVSSLRVGVPEKIWNIIPNSYEEYFHYITNGCHGLLKDQWPWAWRSSQQTDFSYKWSAGQVWIAHYGQGWVPIDIYFFSDDINWSNFGVVDFPKMKK